MELESIRTFADLWEAFKLPIGSSLIGALIGHYAKGGTIQFPLIYISYVRGETIERLDQRLKNPSHRRDNWIRWLLYTPFKIVLFLLSLIGIRFVEDRLNPIIIDLGFLGDILVGIGTAILAKVTLTISGTENEYALIGTSFLAGFAGLAYIREKQSKGLDESKKVEVGKNVGKDHEINLPL